MGANRSEEARSNRIARGGDDDDDDWLRLMKDGWSMVVDADEICSDWGSLSTPRSVLLRALSLSNGKFQNLFTYFLPMHANKRPHLLLGVLPMTNNK